MNILNYCLTEEDIKDYLKDMILIKNLENVPFGTWIRYFSIKEIGENKIKEFNLGGKLIGRHPKHILLHDDTNRKWSVKLINTILYREKLIDDHLEPLYKEIKKLKKQIKKLKKDI